MGGGVDRPDEDGIAKLNAPGFKSEKQTVIHPWRLHMYSKGFLYNRGDDAD